MCNILIAKDYYDNISMYINKRIWLKIIIGTRDQ